MANGLVTKHTDLTSLKYGSMPLGSDKPLITKEIGQAPSSQIGSEISHRIDDTSRIAQMLISKPGIKYLLHEAELQQINVGQRIKKAQKGGKSLVGAVLGQIGNTLVTTAKIVGSTLAQVPVNGTGTHFLKAFRTDTYLQPSGGNTASAFAQFFGAGGVEGAQYALRGEEVVGGHKTELTDKYSKYDYDEYLNVATGSNQPKINAEKGAPIVTGDKQTTQSPGYLGSISNSTSGSTIAATPVGSEFKDKSTFTQQHTYDNALTPSGSASIAKTKDTTKVDVKGNPIELSKAKATLGDNGNNKPKKAYQDSATGSYAKSTSTTNIGLALGGSELPTGGTTPDSEIQSKYSSIQDANNAAARGHRTQPNRDLGKEYTDGSTYSQEQATRLIGDTTKRAQKEVRVLLGDQGKTTKAHVNYWTPAQPLERDGINMLDVSDRVDAAGAGRDLAKFYFEIITPESPSKFLYFRAHIKNIDDSFNANWESHKYVGRAENFYTYGGFDRDVNFSFTVAAATRDEMRPLYRKMVYLASSTAPTYGASGLMRGTLARITIGSYLDQIPGVITSVKFTVDNNVPWEIAMGQPEGVENDVQVLPMVIECSVSFKPIHDFAPQTGLHHYFTNSHAGPKFFEDGEGDNTKTPITSVLAQKYAEEALAAKVAQAEAANAAKQQAADRAAAQRAVDTSYDSNLAFSAGI